MKINQKNNYIDIDPWGEEDWCEKDYNDKDDKIWAIERIMFPAWK